MQGDDEHEFIEVEGQQVSLADLAGFDLEGVAEKRFMQFPIGIFLWEVIAEPEPPKLTKFSTGGAGWVFNCKCLAVMGVKDNADCPNGNPLELIGKIHRETFFLNKENVADSMGYVKAFLVDIGVPAQKGALSQHCLNSVGLKFQAAIQHTKKRDDKDAPPFVGFNRAQGKIIPQTKLAAAAA